MKGAVRRRYLCSPEGATAHTFSVIILEDPTARVVPTWTPPPACPRHHASHVVRNGTYGKHTSRPRQRYRCQPFDGSPRHSFTPPLPRDHVHLGHERCEVCEELVGAHRGETAVARRHSWSARVVARGLDQLSVGETYASVSRWALRSTGIKRTRVPPRPKKGRKSKKTVSEEARVSRAVWHIAADWTEAFAPVIYEPVDTRLRASALVERERIDALVARRRKVERPQVIIIDDLPQWGTDPSSKMRRSRQAGFAVLVVAELHWPDPTTSKASPSLRLRLVRAMPDTTAISWMLVLDELGYQPDVVVADGGTGSDLAVRTLWSNGKTTVVPSMWHLSETIRRAFEKAKRAWVNSDGTAGDLIEPLNAHVAKLSRSHDALRSAISWEKWWDDLVDLVMRNGLPIEGIRKARKKWEGAVLDALPVIRRYPTLPISTGGLESLMLSKVMPLLAKRGNAFANIERTNLLFDLVVARDHGAFDNLSDVVRALREDAQREDGWAVSLRSISDPRPQSAIYSSLRDAVLITDLARARGLVP